MKKVENISRLLMYSSLFIRVVASVIYSLLMFFIHGASTM